MLGDVLMRVILAILAYSLAFSTASAQSVLDSIESAVEGRSAELARAEQLLADPDPRRRIAAMEAILASGDPALTRMAREVGLFSDDPRLRAAAIRATLNAGGAFRAEFQVPADQADLTPIFDWLSRAGGSWSPDGLTGYFGFAVGAYNDAEACWLWLNSQYCVFRMAGEEVMTVRWHFAGRDGSAVMRLDDAGALTGSFVVEGRGTAVTIRVPLID